MQNKKAIRIIIILLIISVVALIACIVSDVYSYYKNKNQEQQLVEEIEKIIVDIGTEKEQGSEQGNEQDTEGASPSQDGKTVVVSDNKKAYGIIKIDKINLKQSILEYNDLNFKNSICNLMNTEISAEQSLYLVGHNMRNGTVFGKLKKLVVGDIIEITNINGECYKYAVSRIIETDSTSEDIYESEENELLTLITCTSSGKKKLVIKATPKGTGDFGGE